MQSSWRDINEIYLHLSEALRSDSSDPGEDFPNPGQVFVTDEGKRKKKPSWGQGVVVRNMDDGLTNDENFNVVPGTFWHDDIWPPNQIYPWGDDSGAKGTHIMGVDGLGAWVTPTLAVAIGPEHFIGDNGIFNHPNLQDADWTDGVWYAHDSNSCDKRALYCKGTDEKGDYEGYDCPGAWVDLKNYIPGNPFILTPDPTKLGSGYYLAGNPHNPDKDKPGKNFGGGGTGMHCGLTYHDVSKENPQYEYQINGYIKGGLAAESLFCNFDCEIDYHTWNESTKEKGREAVDNWLGWIERFSDAAIKQLPRPVSAWAADLAIGWMNNPRPMITLQNALWVYRDYWCDPTSIQPKDPNSPEHYWGWNEIPLPRKLVTLSDNWTCFIIVLPPCETRDITLSQWLHGNPECVENLIDQLNNYTNYNLVPNLSQVLVVKQIPNDSEFPHKVWKRWFFTEQVEIGGGWKIGENGVIQKF